MEKFRYLDNVTTLDLDQAACTGCGSCEDVCPHHVFEVREHKAKIRDKNGCMECGACATNCPVAAICVNPGVGCAAYIIQTWFKGKEHASCGGPGCC